MILMAIDASTHSTGVAIFKDNKLIHYQCIEAHDNKSFTRIWKMVERIRQLYQQYEPTKVIMEDVLPQDVKNNQQVFKALIYLQAAVVLQLDRLGTSDVDLIVASHWRAQCGIKTGRGIKRQQLKKASIKLIKQIYGLDVNDDISDAICLGIAYLSQHKSAF